MRLKELFCNHFFKKTGSLRDGGFLGKNGKVSMGMLFYSCECVKCGQFIWVHVEEKE